MAEATQRIRLDRLLVDRGLYATRSRARDAIGRGAISVDGSVIDRAGARFGSDCAISIDDPARSYVSRAALKLKAALEAFDVAVAGRVCLDLGASTGGFTQVLLEAGAVRVHAIEVGQGQMDAGLREDSRVRLVEGLNARDLTAEMLEGDQLDVIVCDVSFISLTIALPPALEIAASGAHLIALIKPQFEVGRDKIGRGGLVAPGDAAQAATTVTGWLNAQPGWTVGATIASPIAGGDGNREFLMSARKS